jgi:hypothetical protein
VGSNPTLSAIFPHGSGTRKTQRFEVAFHESDAVLFLRYPDN